MTDLYKNQASVERRTSIWFFLMAISTLIFAYSNQEKDAMATFLLICISLGFLLLFACLPGYFKKNVRGYQAFCYLDRDGKPQCQIEQSKKVKVHEVKVKDDDVDGFIGYSYPHIILRLGGWFNQELDRISEQEFFQNMCGWRIVSKKIQYAEPWYQSSILIKDLNGNCLWMTIEEFLRFKSILDKEMGKQWQTTSNGRRQGFGHYTLSEMFAWLVDYQAWSKINLVPRDQILNSLESLINLLDDTKRFGKSKGGALLKVAILEQILLLEPDMHPLRRDGIAIELSKLKEMAEQL